MGGAAAAKVWCLLIAEARRVRREGEAGWPMGICRGWDGQTEGCWVRMYWGGTCTVMTGE